MHFTASQKQAMLFLGAVFLLLALLRVTGRWLYPPAKYDFSAFEQQFRARGDSINALFAPARPPQQFREPSESAPSPTPRRQVANSLNRVTSEPTPARPAGKINLNTATIDELTTLPRVGPTIAARIIAYRTENGRFATVEDLMRVRGIGPKTFAKLQEWITVE